MFVVSVFRVWSVLCSDVTTPNVGHTKRMTHLPACAIPHRILVITTQSMCRKLTTWDDALHNWRLPSCHFVYKKRRASRYSKKNTRAQDTRAWHMTLMTACNIFYILIYIFDQYFPDAIVLSSHKLNIILQYSRAWKWGMCVACVLH